nr:NUDIX domain-containing protein [Lentilactobacillus hilgardii]
MIEVNSSLVVIKKNGGPYINRYDLPGGSLEDGEALQNAIIREIKEATGLVLKEITQLGIKASDIPGPTKNGNIISTFAFSTRFFSRPVFSKIKFLNLLVKIP